MRLGSSPEIRINEATALLVDSESSSYGNMFDALSNHEPPARLQMDLDASLAHQEVDEVRVTMSDEEDELPERSFRLSRN